jgi:hypothetical protein
MGNSLDCCKDTTTIDNELESEVNLIRENMTLSLINSNKKVKQQDMPHIKVAKLTLNN